MNESRPEPNESQSSEARRIVELIYAGGMDTTMFLGSILAERDRKIDSLRSRLKKVNGELAERIDSSMKDTIEITRFAASKARVKELRQQVLDEHSAGELAHDESRTLREELATAKDALQVANVRIDVQGIVISERDSALIRAEKAESLLAKSAEAIKWYGLKRGSDNADSIALNALWSDVEKALALITEQEEKS